MARKGLIPRLRSVVRKYLETVYHLHDVQVEMRTFLQTARWSDAIHGPPYDDPLRLTRYGYKVYSESDEDGILAEIFRRIGTESKTFFEFGAGDGLTNNTHNLLMGGWSGSWIEGSGDLCAQINRQMQHYIAAGRLKVLNEFITCESINRQIQKLALPKTIDLLCIDIDGNDFWIWKAIEATTPRVVVIEYNATLHPPHSLVMEYKEDNCWNGSNYFGASLTALEKLGREKGYSLVACNYTGVNAFFVRSDLARGGIFREPFTAETHYEPGRYYRLKAGHPPGTGKYVGV